EDGPHAVTFRYSNPEQVPGTHYNPNPLGRHADISVDGGPAERVMFPPTFHENNFWERTVVLELTAGENTITLASEELPNFDGETYAEDNWPGILLRARHAPIVDRISVAPFAAVAAADGPGEDPTDPGEDPTGPDDGDVEPTAPDGSLPSTGAPVAAAVLLAALLAAAGAVLLRRRLQD